MQCLSLEERHIKIRKPPPPTSPTSVICHLPRTRLCSYPHSPYQLIAVKPVPFLMRKRVDLCDTLRKFLIHAFPERVFYRSLIQLVYCDYIKICRRRRKFEFVPLWGVIFVCLQWIKIPTCCARLMLVGCVRWTSVVIRVRIGLMIR